MIGTAGKIAQQLADYRVKGSGEIEALQIDTVKNVLAPSLSAMHQEEGVILSASGSSDSKTIMVRYELRKESLVI